MEANRPINPRIEALVALNSLQKKLALLLIKWVLDHFRISEAHRVHWNGIITLSLPKEEPCAGVNFWYDCCLRIRKKWSKPQLEKKFLVE